MKKDPHIRFLPIFLSQVLQIDLILQILSLVHQIDFAIHILIVLNDLDKWAVISPMLDQSKIKKNAFLNDPKSQNGVFLERKHLKNEKKSHNGSIRKVN